MKWLALLGLFVTSQEGKFVDVPPNHWAAPAVTNLGKEGILVGMGGQFTNTIDPDDLRGKTPEQILAMGRDAWTKFANKNDQTNQNLASTQSTWAWVVTSHCEEIRFMNQTERNNAASWIHSCLNQFLSRMTDVGSAISGGGSMRTLNHAQAFADNADVYRALMDPRRIGKMPPMTKKDVWKELGKLRKTIRANKAKIDRMGKYPEAAESALMDINIAMEYLRYFEPRAKELGKKEYALVMHQATRLGKLAQLL